MVENLKEEISNGRIFRRKTCDRCGAVDYEKLTGYTDEGYASRAEFETHGFGKVKITAWDMNFKPKQLCLCNKCAEDFVNMLMKFIVEFEDNDD